MDQMIYFHFGADWFRHHLPAEPPKAVAKNDVQLDASRGTSWQNAGVLCLFLLVTVVLTVDNDPDPPCSYEYRRE